jgi:hypothetical protein
LQLLHQLAHLLQLLSVVVQDLAVQPAAAEFLHGVSPGAKMPPFQRQGRGTALLPLPRNTCHYGMIPGHCFEELLLQIRDLRELPALSRFCASTTAPPSW